MQTREEYLEWYNKYKSPSGYFAKEKWQVKNNTYEQFLDILKLTSYLSDETKFRERIYHLEQQLFSVPVCDCGNQLSFATTNNYSKKCSDCDHRSKEKVTNKSIYTKPIIDNTISLKEFINTYLLNKNKKLIPQSSNRQWFINRDVLHIYEQIINIQNTLKIKSFNLTIDYILYEKTCKQCNIIIHHDREFCSTKCSTTNEDTKEKNILAWNNSMGVSNPSHNKEILEKILIKKQERWLQTIDKHLFDESHIKPTFEFDGTINAKTLYTLKCIQCNTTFKSRIWYNMNLHCKNCDPYYASYGEKEIYNFLIEYISPEDIIMRHRKTFVKTKIMEVDFYIPSLKLAIEFNGLYYHSEFNGGKDKNYHLTKTNICNQFGIHLIHIFEDEWLYKQDIVKSRLLNLIHKIPNILYARKCIIKEIPANIKNIFLNNNHIQGQDISHTNLGLYHNDILVSVMTFCKPRMTMGKSTIENFIQYELSRFSSLINTNVIGAASKLFSYFKNNYYWNEIYTYADKKWSNGNVYHKLGMDQLTDTQPGYWYYKDKIRYHRSKFMKHKLPKLFPDCDMSKTELEIMLENKYDRIWDCGNYKFSITK